MFRELLLIALGGALGATSRYGVSLAMEALRLPLEYFPFATLAVNVAGCFALGLVAELALLTALVPLPLRMAVTVGFLGSLTTFSTFGYETLRRVEVGQFGVALLNVGANLLLGLVAVWAGINLARLFYE